MKRRAIALFAAAVTAAIFSTLVQVTLWIAFTDRFPALLWRDARLAAALLLGRSALAATEGPDPRVLVAATLVHAGVSLAFATPLALMRLRTLPGATFAGGAYGALLYVVALHGFTLAFPWFANARGPIAFAAHLAFGISGALAVRAVGGQRGAR